VTDTFYRTFSEKQLTGAGSARRGRIERARMALLLQYRRPPGRMLEIGPGQGTLAALAVEAGWHYAAVEPSAILADQLRARGLTVIEAFAPPLTAEARRALTPGGVFFVVVPDYLKERGFFWDIDYTHNFPTTERRVRQLLYDGGFEIERVVRSIGVATGVLRDAMAALALLANIPGLDALSRYTRTEELLFKVRKNLFETLTFVARKPDA
jgi:hypothetical protein